MGLDMYLTKRRYVKNWEHQDPSEHHDVTVKLGGKLLKEPFPVKEIIYEVGYWRKANQIHKWFTDNCNGGEEDNGGDIWVNREQLQELLDLCKKVQSVAVLKKGKIQNGTSYSGGKATPMMEDGEYIENAEEVAKLLPTESGFFYGSTDYNQWYMHDIELTIEILEKALASEGGDFYYSGDW